MSNKLKNIARGGRNLYFVGRVRGYNKDRI